MEATLAQEPRCEQAPIFGFIDAIVVLRFDDRRPPVGRWRCEPEDIHLIRWIVGGTMHRAGVKLRIPEELFRTHETIRLSYVGGLTQGSDQLIWQGDLWGTLDGGLPHLALASEE